MPSKPLHSATLVSRWKEWIAYSNFVPVHSKGDCSWEKAKGSSQPTCSRAEGNVQLQHVSFLDMHICSACQLERTMTGKTTHDILILSKMIHFLNWPDSKTECIINLSLLKKRIIILSLVCRIKWYYTSGRWCMDFSEASVFSPCWVNPCAGVGGILGPGGWVALCDTWAGGAEL